jgi:hypothetical protein
LANPNSECFFFVVTSAALLLYKMKPKTSKFKLIKAFQISSVDFSFEPSEGVLGLIGPNDRVSIFYLYQPKGSKAYQGPCISLVASPGLTRPISSGQKGHNLLKFAARMDYNQAQLFKIYESTYLVHIENLIGSLYFYKISGDSVELFAKFSISQGIYGLGMTEHLVILQSYNTQESLIYDIQSQLQDYLIKVSHSELTYPTNNRLSAEFSMPIELNSDVFFVADEVTIDLKSCSFKSFELNPSALIENHPDDDKIILFLLRRDNCKMKVLEKIQESLCMKTSLKKMEIIFSTLAHAYRIAKEDRNQDIKTRKLSENVDRLDLSPTYLDPNIEVKTGSGVTVLMQSDIYYCVFSPIYKSGIDVRYLAEALFSFVHFLIQNKVQVHFSLQYLLFKLLIKIKDYSRVQRLVENKFFSDSQDIALFLISLGKTETIKVFPNCYVLGIDMLYRLKLFDFLMSELAEQEFYYESLSIHKANNLGGDELIKSIVKKCEFEYD